MAFGMGGFKQFYLDSKVKDDLRRLAGFWTFGLIDSLNSRICERGETLSEF